MNSNTRKVHVHDDPSVKNDIEELIAKRRLEDSDTVVTDSNVADEVAKYRLEIMRKKALGRYKRKQKRKTIRIAATTAVLVFAVYLITPGGQVLAKNVLEYIVSIGSDFIKQEGIEGFKPEYSIVPKEYKTFDNVEDASKYIEGVPLYYFDINGVSLLEISVDASEFDYLVSSSYLNKELKIIILHQTISSESVDAGLLLDDLVGEKRRYEITGGMDLYAGTRNDGVSCVIGVKNNVMVQIFADDLNLDELSLFIEQLKLSSIRGGTNEKK